MIRKIQIWLANAISNCNNVALKKIYEEDLLFIKEYLSRLELDIGSYAGLEKRKEKIIERYKDKVKMLE